MTFLISMWLTLIFMALFLSHPVTLSITILFKTLWISLIIGSMNSNFWFSYILILVMIGGMLILLLYMTNVASKEKFKKSWIFNWLAILMLTSIFFSFFLNKFLIFFIPMSHNWMNSEIKIMLMKFFYFPMNFLFIMVTINLLLTMIMSVKITDIANGPLRQKY